MKSWTAPVLVLIGFATSALAGGKIERYDPTQHWAFIPPTRAIEPKVKQRSWPRNAIDRFVLARLEKESIPPSPEADRVTLIRRLSLDLIGLPPSVEEVEAFLDDKRSDAYERLVERLLASPHYGERWGRHWLDVARYADSNGYSVDAPRTIWKYRDWVIDALNRDLSFDQFTIEQLAGDMLPNATMEQKIATGFHRNTMINQEGGIDKEQFRIESIIDRVNTTGTAFLGLTISCAQCHDHKFDPITQKEYFRLFAFLNNADEPDLELASPGELAWRDAWRKQVRELEGAMNQYINSLAGEQGTWEKSLAPEELAKLKPDIKSILETLAEKRTDKQKRALFGVFRPDDPEFKQRIAKIVELEKQEPKFLTTMVMQELATPRESYVFIKGDFTRHGEVVTPGVPKVLPPLPPIEKPNRLDLARWLVDSGNPLTARVMVNRMWQQYFGKGLVATENDFGTQGATPSHPDLLDWLACEFMEPRGSLGNEAQDKKAENRKQKVEIDRSLLTSVVTQPWSFKHIHRLIVTSATYRQSSRVRPELALKDPNNILLARQSRLRLDAEVVRDVALTASGLFADRIGGPSVFPPIPDGVMNLGQSRRPWETSTGADRYRRGMYTFFWRATPHPELIVFDASDATSACTRRVRSNTPLQSLTLLNDQAFFEFAQGLAERVMREAPDNDSERISHAVRLCLARKPSASEKQRLAELLAQQLAGYESEPGEAEKIIAGKPLPGTDVKQLAAWTTVSRVLLNLDETITRE